MLSPAATSRRYHVHDDPRPSLAHPVALGWLLSIDAALIAIHVVVEVTPPPDVEWLLITTSWGLAESVHTIAALAAATVLAATTKWRASARRLDLTVAAMIVVATMFDGFELHRRDSAMAWMSLTAAVLLLAATAIIWPRRRTRLASADRRFGAVVAVLGVCYLVFAIGANVVHDQWEVRASTARNWSGAATNLFLDVVEEGGEMLMSSAIVAVCLARSINARSSRHPKGEPPCDTTA